ncbi:MAG: hypothetical protein Q9227_003621 [Pyrenula ochraceoflavens]
MAPKYPKNATWEEIAQAEDPDDDDYDNRAPAPSASKSRKRRKHGNHKVARKRQKRGYADSDSGVTDGSSDIEDETSEESASDLSPEPETNERGRPVRKTVKTRKTYNEESEDEESDEISEESELEVRPPKRKPVGRPSKLVKLKIPASASSTPAPIMQTRRNTRSGSHAGKTPTPTEPTFRGTRRSSRIAHDENEPMVALTNSGNHVEFTRTATRSPDTLPERPTRGGKGLKKPVSQIVEEDATTSNTKTEPIDDVAEIGASQQEIQESDPQAEVDEPVPRIISDLHEAANEDEGEAEAVPESPDGSGVEEDEDDDDNPILARRKTRLPRRQESPAYEEPSSRGGRELRRSGRNATEKKPTRSSQRKAQEESSDFEPGADEGAEDDMSDSAHSRSPPRKSKEDSESGTGRRSGRLRGQISARQSSGSEEDLISDGELNDIRRTRRPKRKASNPPEILFENRRRVKKPVNYSMLVPPPVQVEEELDDDPTGTPSRREKRGGGGNWTRSLFSTYGPFGGAGGPPPVFGGPPGATTIGGVDSDSSDDEAVQRPKPVGGTVGMTPTTAAPPGLFPAAQPHGADPLQGPGGTPANLGKVKDKQALADADPLGVEQNVSFDKVGGLEGHINSLKEMVALPLLYPEIFQRFHIVPPRGVLFHGPPGTGKTLLARALAASVSSQGRKVTFYMRKGADALSKWVGEAERQLRLLFEEARKNQPSIIFFDEIDGLAPVRSSKQEQIHASIVSTLLALMDGMDGRGQVIVIGATNRPDSVDPALRRPGRFDREFYFPLPNVEARREIINIHTRGWDPPLPELIKDELARVTKGYGGADLRALCTEAALNAVQRRYPQIYTADEKLLIDPKKIEVTPRDFMMSVKKLVPSSERSASSGAAPLPAAVEPLLRDSFKEITAVLEDILPRQKQLTALEEAKFEQPSDAIGFRREKMQQNFELSRVFRPRLLVRGPEGFGQQYLAAALLHHFEGLHVQSFDLPTLLSDSTRSPEAAIVQLFSEAKTRKPSVIYIPNVQSWYAAVGATVISTFLGMLRSLSPSDPILVLGVLEATEETTDQDMIKSLFGYTKRNQYGIQQPGKEARREFFATLFGYIKTPPKDFPDPTNRKPRTLEVLKPAPPEEPKSGMPLSKAELQAQKKRDRTTLNFLKIRLQIIMNEIKKAYKMFIKPVIGEESIRYLFEESDPTRLQSDQPLEVQARASFRPYEKSKDSHGEPGLLEVASEKFYYNLEIVTIEKRLSNGYYKRPRDFLADIQRLAKDAKTLGEHHRLMKANELLANCEVDIYTMEMENHALVAECEKVYERELEREKTSLERARKKAEEEGLMPPPVISNVPHNADSGPSSVNASTGPIVLGITDRMPNGHLEAPSTPSKPSRTTQNSGLTNGYAPADGSDLNEPRAPTSNGSSSNADGDVHMTNSEEHNSGERDIQQSSFGPSAQERPLHSYTAPSQALRQASGMSAPLSQKENVTPMRPGSQPGDYTNEASTTQTTSHPKTSDRSSAPQNPFNTQSTNGDGPNLNLYGDRRYDTDGHLPDTQDYPLSQGSAGATAGSQAVQPLSQHDSEPQPQIQMFESPSHSSHRPSQSNINALLNNDDEIRGQPDALEINHGWIDRVHAEVTDQTSGCSVEQLEQVNSAMMDCVWKLRGRWNRTEVAAAVKQTFNEVMGDIQEMQAKSRSLQPYFPEHIPRNIYLSLLHLSDNDSSQPKVPDSLLRAALLNRAVEDIHRIMHIRSRKQALGTLLQRGSVGDEIWQRLLRAERELEAEVREVVEEANAFQPNWGQTIFQSANEMANRQLFSDKLAAIQKTVPKEKEKWDKQREAVREGFMKELDESEKAKREAEAAIAEAKRESDEDAVLVEKAEGGKEGGKKGKKKGKK